MYRGEILRIQTVRIFPDLCLYELALDRLLLYKKRKNKNSIYTVPFTISYYLIFDYQY